MRGWIFFAGVQFGQVINTLPWIHLRHDTRALVIHTVALLLFVGLAVHSAKRAGKTPEKEN